MVTLWFKSSLCFSTLLTFDSSFFLPLPSFFVTFSQTVSDHVIHARLHVVWTRTKGIQSQWTLTETSVKLQQNGGGNRAADCGQGCCCCDVNLCPVNVWTTCKLQTKVQDTPSTNTLRHPITYLTGGTAWPVKVFEGWLRMLHSLAQQLLPLLCHSCPVPFIFLSSASVSWIKKASC